jgi:hypothetical protein
VELNVFWKDGGDGLPPEEGEQARKAAAGGSAFASKPSTASMGDSGASWRLKALIRARQAAEREGKALSEVRHRPMGC